jgi:polyferredoxin
MAAAAHCAEAERPPAEREGGRSHRQRKKLVRRPSPDRSQTLRRAIQLAFIVLNLAIGAQFCLFVRQFETPGGPIHHGRPAGVEGWLPIAGLMNLKFFLFTGNVPSIHPAAMFLLVAFLAASVIFRKSFCSWLCPIGTLSEWLWKLGRRALRRNFSFPRWLDLPLRSLKYLLLAFFLYAVGGISAAGIQSFMTTPYGLMADVKMLHFFRYLSTTAAVTLLALAILSVVYQNFWCRYLCPYGALMGIASLASPTAVRRDPDRCIDCAKCARVCPSLLPVDRLITVRSAECTSCLECVAVCPAEGALEVGLPRRRRLPSWAVAAGVAAIFLAVVGYAKLSGSWDSRIPPAVYQELLPALDTLQHP